jgi:hypothetical protein
MAEVCKPGSGWEDQQIKSTDAPEFTGEEVSDALRGVLASKAWVEAKRQQWGETSPAYVARILAEFPDISNDTLIMPKWIEAAIARELERNRRPKLGADIARYGDDTTTIYRREGGWVRKYHEHAKTDTMVTAGHIAKALRDIAAERDLNDFPTAVIDEVGVGAGVLDRLQEQGLDVAGFNGGSEPRDKERFVKRPCRALLEDPGGVRGRAGRPRQGRRRARRPARCDQVVGRLEGPDQDREQGGHAQARPPLPRPRGRLRLLVGRPRSGERTDRRNARAYSAREVDFLTEPM